MIRRLSLITFVFCLISGWQVYAGISLRSEYSYNQQGNVSFEGSESIVGNLERTVTLPNATYTFDVESANENFYELKSQARFEVDIDGRAINGRSGDGWDSTSVRAFSSSQLVDTTFVDGIQGQSSGFAEFLWDITGASTITVNPQLSSDAYFVDQLFTTALFNTLEGQAIPELELNDQSRPPLGTSSVESIVPGFFEPVVIAVDWLVGQELDVFFELQTSARLDIMNLDAAGFNAVVDSDFSNTAVLREIRIYDENGDLIPDAFLRSSEDDFIYDPAGLGLGIGGTGGGGPATGGGGTGGGGTGGGDPNVVPEPTTMVIWLVLGGLVGVGEFRRRKSS